jgi:protoheme IX farnesyltransferase
VPAKMQMLELLDSWRPLSGHSNAVAKHIGLTKMPLSYLMAASAAAAYVARKSAFEWIAFETIFYLFLLCLGAATLNNYQDRDIDKQLQRTRKRPLVFGEIGSRAALIQALALILCGTVGFLFASRSIALATTGLIAVCLYNLIYTPLKRRTSLAIIPGAVCGTLPILMGWMAAGGALRSPKLWILMVVFGVWQLPHFWLVVLGNQRDYRESGIPNMLRALSVRQLDKLVLVWVSAFAVVTLFLPLYRVVLSEVAAWVLFANAAILTSAFGLLLFFRHGATRYRELFRYLSLSVAVVMAVIMLDGIAYG